MTKNEKTAIAKKLNMMDERKDRIKEQSAQDRDTQVFIMGYEKCLKEFWDYFSRKYFEKE